MASTTRQALLQALSAAEGAYISVSYTHLRAHET